MDYYGSYYSRRIIFSALYYCGHNYFKYIQTYESYESYISSEGYKQIGDQKKEYQQHLLELEKKNHIAIINRNRLLRVLDIINQMQHEKKSIYLQSIKFSDKGFSIVGVAKDSDVWKHFNQKIETYIKGIEVTRKHKKCDSGRYIIPYGWSY